MINIPQLLISLWQGKLKCEKGDDKASWDWATFDGNAWTEHGKLVRAATAYFPSFFHRPPRNPTEKLSSGYKATEYYLYVFGLGPGLFRSILPHKYWKNFCKLAHATRILMQRSITAKQVNEAHSYSIQFVEEYEHLYYQRRIDRIHFCRPALHTLLHAASEVARIGPGVYSTQFPMERSVYIFSCGIRLHSNPHSNLMEITLREAQLNALGHICPEFDHDADTKAPSHARDVGDGYLYLAPWDKRPFIVTDDAQKAVLLKEIGYDTVVRWGRAQLPNGQIARSVMSESRRKRSVDKRNSRNVKV